jgi:T4-like virus tail tube protein gp19
MIERFRGSFTTDLAKPSRFDVKILVPPVLNGIISTETLSYRCENAVLPGRTIETADLRIYGPSEKYPVKSTYEDITLTFLVTNSMDEKKLFDSWLNYINPTTSWNFEYKKNYVAPSIVITQYDVVGDAKTGVPNPTQSIELIEAYPIAVNQLDLDWSSDGYHKLSVVFTYRYWRDIESNSVDEQIQATTPTDGGPEQDVNNNVVQNAMNDYITVKPPIGGMNLSS